MEVVAVRVVVVVQVVVVVEIVKFMKRCFHCQLTFLERRLSRFDRMNSFEMLDASEFRLIDNASRTSSASLNAVDRDRPSSKKKLVSFIKQLILINVYFV